MTIDDLAVRLDALATRRQSVLDRITAAAGECGAGALLLIGSLGRGGGDAFSDLDLIIVPGHAHTDLDVEELFGGQILARLDVPGNAPEGGIYQGLCLDAGGVALWLDVYTWPAATAAIPCDATAVFDNIGLPRSDEDFIALITAHADTNAVAHPPGGAAMLLRIGVTAKYLARGDMARVAGRLPDASGLSLPAIPALLHDLLALVDDRDLTAAATATGALIDLAASALEGRA